MSLYFQDEGCNFDLPYLMSYTNPGLAGPRTDKEYLFGAEIDVEKKYGPC